jgi:RNA polymerase sigma-70 factor (ECF subfamily)
MSLAAEPDPTDGRSPRGESAALARLVEHAVPILRRVAPTLMDAALRERCRTSDLVQSALCEAIVSMPAFRGNQESEFVGWTLRIMEHNAIDRRRRLSAQKRRLDREQGGQSEISRHAGSERSPSQVAIDREELVRMAKAMRRLPAEQRRVLQLVALRGMSHAEAAEVLGRSEGACRVLLARARAGLLVAMARCADGAD